MVAKEDKDGNRSAGTIASAWGTLRRLGEVMSRALKSRQDLPAAEDRKQCLGLGAQPLTKVNGAEQLFCCGLTAHRGFLNSGISHHPGSC